MGKFILFDINKMSPTFYICSLSLVLNQIMNFAILDIEIKDGLGWI